MTITVYTKPSCVQCDATKRGLNNIGKKLGLGDEEGAGWYEVIDLAENPDAVADLKAQNLMSAPAVFQHEDGVLTEKWGGFRPDKLADVEKKLTEALVAA